MVSDPRQKVKTKRKEKEMPGKRKRSPSAASSSSEESDSSSSSAAGVPAGSKERYFQVWNEFVVWLKANTRYRAGKPKEVHFTDYFKACHANGMAASTLWSYYSMLGSVFTHKHGKKLKDEFPRLAVRLKGYSKAASPPKQATPFTGAEILTYLQKTPGNVVDIQNHALVCLSHFGGLRTSELREINIDNLVRLPDGTIEVTYNPKKNITAKQEPRTYHVPLAPELGNLFTSRVEAHLANLHTAKIMEGPLARRANKNKDALLSVVVGRNTLYDLPKVVAVCLGKSAHEVERYTGHSFRRSAARVAADNGATTLALRRHFGWANEKTPQRYVDNSFVNNKDMSSKLLPSVTSPCPPAPSPQPTGTGAQQASIHVPQSNSNRFTIDININLITPRP